MTHSSFVVFSRGAVENQKRDELLFVALVIR
jgi:hypothetical protein